MDTVQGVSHWLPKAAPERGSEPAPARALEAAAAKRAVESASRGQGGENGVGQDGKGLEAALSRLEDYAQRHAHDLKFSVDDVTGQILVKVVDPKTDQVVRQIPPEEAVALARFLQEQGDENGGALLRAEA